MIELGKIFVGRARNPFEPEEFGKVVANAVLAGLLFLFTASLQAVTHYQTLFHS